MQLISAELPFSVPGVGDGARGSRLSSPQAESGPPLPHGARTAARSCERAYGTTEVNVVRTRRLVVLFGLALIAVAAFLLATSIMGAEADRGPGITAAGDYQGADTCQSCHATE